MNTSSLLIYFFSYFFLTLLLFVLFRKRILEQNSLRYLFFTSVLLGAVAPFLCIVFGPRFTVALLACLSIGLSAFYVFYTLREDRNAQTWEEDFVTDIEKWPSYAETFYEEESLIKEEQFPRIEAMSSTDSHHVNLTTEIYPEHLTIGKFSADESPIPQHPMDDNQRTADVSQEETLLAHDIQTEPLPIHSDNPNLSATEEGEADQLLAFEPDQELKPLKWDQEQTKITSAAALPYSFVDNDEMIDTEKAENKRDDDEPMLNVDSLAEFRFEGENNPLYPNEEAAAIEKPAQLMDTDAQPEQIPLIHQQGKKPAEPNEPKQRQELLKPKEPQEDQEEDKAYHAYLEQILQEEGLIDTPNNDARR